MTYWFATRFLAVIAPLWLIDITAGQTRSLSLRSSCTKSSVNAMPVTGCSFHLIFFDRGLGGCIELAVAIAGITAKPRQLLLCRCDESGVFAGGDGCVALLSSSLVTLSARQPPDRRVARR